MLSFYDHFVQFQSSFCGGHLQEVKPGRQFIQVERGPAAFLDLPASQLHTGDAEQPQGAGGGCGKVHLEEGGGGVGIEDGRNGTRAGRLLFTKVRKVSGYRKTVTKSRRSGRITPWTYWRLKRRESATCDSVE